VRGGSGSGLSAPSITNLCPFWVTLGEVRGRRRCITQSEKNYYVGEGLVLQLWKGRGQEPMIFFYEEIFVWN